MQVTVNWRGKQFIATKAGLIFRGTRDELEEWAKRNLLKFSEDKHRVLSLSQNNPQAARRVVDPLVGAAQLKSIGMLAGKTG